MSSLSTALLRRKLSSSKFKIQNSCRGKSSHSRDVTCNVFTEIGVIAHKMHISLRFRVAIERITRRKNNLSIFEWLDLSQIRTIFAYGFCLKSLNFDCQKLKGSVRLAGVKESRASRRSSYFLHEDGRALKPLRFNQEM
jgi:hypothetical protein